MAMQFAPPQPAASSSALDEPPRTDIDDTLQCWPSAMKEQEYTDLASPTKPAKQSSLPPGSRFGSATFSAEIGRLSMASFVACAYELIALLTALGGAWWYGRMCYRARRCRAATAVQRRWRGHASRRALRRAAAARLIRIVWRARRARHALSDLRHAHAFLIQVAWRTRASNIGRWFEESLERTAAVERSVAIIAASWRSYALRDFCGDRDWGEFMAKAAAGHLLGVTASWRPPVDAEEAREQAKMRASCAHWARMFKFGPKNGRVCGRVRHRGTLLAFVTPYSCTSDDGVRLMAASGSDLRVMMDAIRVARRVVAFDAKAALSILRRPGADRGHPAWKLHGIPTGLETRFPAEGWQEDVVRWRQTREGYIDDLERWMLDYGDMRARDPSGRTFIDPALEGIPSVAHQEERERSFSAWVVSEVAGERERAREAWASVESEGEQEGGATGLGAREPECDEECESDVGGGGVSVGVGPCVERQGREAQ